MNWLDRRVQSALAIICGVALSGCAPSGSVGDEQKESHYLMGKSRVSSMDYPGAISAFEEALEVNPHSASAHFELAYLYDQKEPDPAAAIYHYEKFLRLNPQSDRADLVRGRIMALKQDLVRTVAPLSMPPDVQRQIEKLLEDKRQLTEEVERLRALLAVRGSVPPTGPVPASNPGAGTMAGSTPSRAAAPVESSPPPAVSRTHTVVSGETPIGIARKYNVKLDALMSANPGLNPTRMQVGQKLNIPAQ